MGLVGLLIGIIGPMSSTVTIPTLNLMQLTTGATVLVAGTTTVVVSGWAVVGVGAALSGLIMFAKPSKLSKKETSSDKPSWVNSEMINKTKSPQQNAVDILNEKYGFNNWRTGARSEYNQIVKWIERWLKYYKGW